MRHHNNIKSFNRPKNQREALMKSLARSLVIKEKIRTTGAKAKSLRPFVERVITYAKKGTIASKRDAIALVGVDTSKKLDELAKRFEDRKGGYTRITKLPRRMSDGSTMSVIEFV